MKNNNERADLLTFCSMLRQLLQTVARQAPGRAWAASLRRYNARVCAATVRTMSTLSTHGSRVEALEEYEAKVELVHHQTCASTPTDWATVPSLHQACESC